MSIRSYCMSKFIAVCALGAFMLLIFPVHEFAQVNVPGGSLIGFIYEKDMKTPVPSAIVKLKNIKDQKEFSSSPSDDNGMYRVTGLPEGRYILGVSSSKGEFNFTYFLTIKNNEVAKLSLALAPGAAQEQGEESARKSFFKSPAGIMLLVTAAGIVLYAVLAKEEEVSPIR